jgi:outer membrane protein assembly factor BamA
VPLADTIREIKESKLTPPRADDAAYYLRIFYRKQGYAEAEVTWEIRGSRLVLKIQEGTRSYLGEVKFTFPKGEQSYNRDELYSYMVGETKERKKKDAPPKLPFIDAEIDTGISRLRGFYESEGFARVSIKRLDKRGEPGEDAKPRRGRIVDGERLIDIPVEIKEGDRYRFADPVFVGAPPGDGSKNDHFTPAKLGEALGNPTGDVPVDADPAPIPPIEQPFTAQRANSMQHNLLHYFKLHGYYQAKVEVEAKLEAARRGEGGDYFVPVKFIMTPGAFYRFDGSTVKFVTPENEPKYKQRLKDDFLPKRFANLTGKPYDPRLLDERYRELLKTGVFKRLSVKTEALPETDEVQIQVEAEEAKAREIGFSIGYSSYDGAVAGLRLADRNFMGNGRPLTLDINYSLRGLGTELTHINPWWLDSNFGLRSKLFAQTRTEVDYEKQEAGIRFDLTRKLNKLEYGLNLGVRNVNITETDILPEFLGPTSYQIGTLGISQTLDFRDNVLSPSRGWIWNMGIEADTIAGEVAFGKATTRLSYYLPIKKKYLLALGARGGLILPLTSVPIDERFFNGGASSVRSFRERELGPQDLNGHFIGGEAYTTFNAEFQFPLKDALFGAVFVDAGNLHSALDDAGIEDMRYAVGVGLRYKLPVGPVRLDVGFNPNPKLGEAWGAIHFSFGFAF